MKPIHYIIISLAAGILLFTLFYTLKKRRDVKEAQRDNLVKGIVAIATMTAVVDPTTGVEYNISDYGENNLDGGDESRKMKMELGKVIADISTRSATIPAMLTLKVYDANMRLLSSSQVKNPFGQIIARGVPAQRYQTASGIDYSCSGIGGATAAGPDFFSSPDGMLFGMFCKR